MMVTAKGKEIGKSHCNRSVTYIWHSCLGCGKERWVRLMKDGTPKSTHCKRCGYQKVSSSRISHKNINWKGGYKLDGGGYITVRIYPDNPYYEMAEASGYVKLHRLLMAEFMMRPLANNEVVHHKNGDIRNNNIKNLEIMGIREHHQLHDKRRGRDEHNKFNKAAVVNA